jgi:hypothetical protein
MMSYAILRTICPSSGKIRTRARYNAILRIQCAKDSVTLTNKEIDKRFNKFKNDFSKEIKDKYLDLDSNSI